MSEIKALRTFSIPELNKRALENTEEKEYHNLAIQKYGFRVLQKGDILGPEVHEHETQISGVVQGKITLTIRDGKTHTKEEGKIFKVPPKTEHIIVALEPTKLWSVYV